MASSTPCLLGEEVVSEPKHLDAAPAEVRLPPVGIKLYRWLEVLPAIELDSQASRGQ